MTEINDNLNAAVAGRMDRVREQMLETLSLYNAGDSLKAEKTTERANAARERQRFQLKNARKGSVAVEGAESLQGDRENFLPVSFLANGAGTSRAVARVIVPSRGEMGSGFLCAPGLFLTNYHVLSSIEAASTAEIEFDYVDGDHIEPTKYRLDPKRLFIYDNVDRCDYVIIAVGERISGTEELTDFGWCPLSDASNKHALGEFANIIQHPRGRPKQVVLQDNLIAGRSDFILHYFADTQPGSSGSPVFNNFWQVIAVHHWGVALNDPPTDGSYNPRSVNEGVRVSKIVANARMWAGQLKDPAQKKLVEDMIARGSSTHPIDVLRWIPLPQNSRGSSIIASPRLDSDMQTTGSFQTGRRKEISSSLDSQQLLNPSTSLTIPLQISIAIPGLSSPLSSNVDATRANEPSRAVEPGTEVSTTDTSTGAESTPLREGEGYRPDFLDKNAIPLPTIARAAQKDIAELLEPERYPSAKKGELQYTHFSTVVNKERKMPFFGACNVDGDSLFGISSKTGDKRNYASSNARDFRARAAEASTSWKPDHRISEEDQTTENWYRGYNKLIPRPQTDDRSRYIAKANFDRGHIVRRTEPIWGSEQAGREASIHSYTHANAAPQEVLFNQDKTRPDKSIDEGEEKRSWYGMEVAILRAAHEDGRKMCVFTGPVFADDDPIYGPGQDSGGLRQIPMIYWKIAVWESEGKLKSLAMKYSQEWTIVKSGNENGAERLDSEEELLLLRDFLTTVEDIEQLTDVRFSKKVKSADLLNGLSETDFSKLDRKAFRKILKPRR